MAEPKKIRIYNNTKRLAFLPPLSARTAAANGGQLKAREHQAVIPGSFVDVDPAYLAQLTGGKESGGWYHKEFVCALEAGDWSAGDPEAKPEAPRGTRKTFEALNEVTTLKDAADANIAAVEAVQSSRSNPLKRMMSKKD